METKVSQGREVLRVCLVCRATGELMVFLESPAKRKVTMETQVPKGCQV